MSTSFTVIPLPSFSKTEMSEFRTPRCRFPCSPIGRWETETGNGHCLSTAVRSCANGYADPLIVDRDAAINYLDRNSIIYRVRSHFNRLQFLGYGDFY